MTVGDYGQPFLIQASGLDLTKTDTQSLNVTKPDGTKVTWSPLVITSKTITYVIETGDLDQAGAYNGELVVTWGILVDPPGRDTSSIFQFIVDPSL